MDKEKEIVLPSQGIRTPRDQCSGVIVPDAAASSSSVGLAVATAADASAEKATAEQKKIVSPRMDKPGPKSSKVGDSISVRGSSEDIDDVG